MQTIEIENGTVYYLYHNVIHRDDGPAVIYADGEKFWYLHGTFYGFDDYLEKLSKTKSHKEIMLLRLKYG